MKKVPPYSPPHPKFFVRKIGWEHWSIQLASKTNRTIGEDLFKESSYFILQCKRQTCEKSPQKKAAEIQKLKRLYHIHVDN